MRVGYVRVSTEEQNTARQEVIMNDLKADRIFIDKISGKSKDRPQLQEMMGFVREGDTVIVESISRFARNTKDLLELVETLTEKHVEFVSKKESIDTTTPAGKFMLTVFAAVAELERGYILDRQREGIAIARANGKYKGKPMKQIDQRLWDELYPLWENGDITAVDFMKRIGLKKSAFYERVRKMK